MTEGSFNSCISLILQGNMQGMKQIYEEYGKMIYAEALRVSRSPHLAEDATSEFFLRLKSAASVYKAGRGHKKWLLISARNLTIDIMRKEGREIPSSVSEGEEESHPLSEIPDSADTEEAVSSKLNALQMLDKLSSEQREIVHLKIYCGLTFTEIADMLQIPAGTAAWRYSTAVKKLRAIYKEVSE